MHVSIVVLASPDDAAVSLDDLCDHVVDESVLVVNALCFELGLELLLIDLCKQILEEAIVLLEDGVLG